MSFACKSTMKEASYLQNKVMFMITVVQICNFLTQNRKYL